MTPTTWAPSSCCATSYVSSSSSSDLTQPMSVFGSMICWKQAEHMGAQGSTILAHNVHDHNTTLSIHHILLSPRRS